MLHELPGIPMQGGGGGGGGRGQIQDFQSGGILFDDSMKRC